MDADFSFLKCKLFVTLITMTVKYAVGTENVQKSMIWQKRNKRKAYKAKKTT